MGFQKKTAVLNGLAFSRAISGWTKDRSRFEAITHFTQIAAGVLIHFRFSLPLTLEFRCHSTMEEILHNRLRTRSKACEFANPIIKLGEEYGKPKTSEQTI